MFLLWYNNIVIKCLGVVIIPNINAIIKDIKALDIKEQEQLLSFLEEALVLNSYTSKITEEVKEHRFSKRKVCPHCKSDKVSRNGKYNNRQRYICKSCNKTFTDFTNSATYNSKKTLDK